MADRLIRHNRTFAVALRRLCCVSLFAVVLPAAAQSGISDPTRPPSGVATTSDAANANAAAPGGSLLQSVMIPKDGKPMAIIGGQQVKLGEKYGDSRLIRVSESEVVLKGPSGLEHLRLTPDIDKTHTIEKTPATKTRQSKGTP